MLHQFALHKCSDLFPIKKISDVFLILYFWPPIIFPIVKRGFLSSNKYHVSN